MEFAASSWAPGPLFKLSREVCIVSPTLDPKPFPAPPSHFLPSAASSPVAPACWPQGKILPHPSARSALHSSPQDGGPKGKMIEGRRGDLGGALEENCGPHLTAVLLTRRTPGWIRYHTLTPNRT